METIHYALKRASLEEDNSKLIYTPTPQKIKADEYGFLAIVFHSNW